MTSHALSPPSCPAGIIWPVECIPYPLRYISLALPQTYASEALRCIMYRGNVYTHCTTRARFIMVQVAVARESDGHVIRNTASLSASHLNH